MRLRIVISVVALVAALAPAAAQTEAPQPEMGSQATEQAAPQPQPVAETYPILIIGDALAGGLGAGLARMAEAEPQYQVVNRFQETSGIARPEVYDWAASLPQIMDGKNFKAAVVLIGANDRQEIKDGDARYAFNTPEWRKAYSAQVARLLDALKPSGVKIFWVAIPPMGDAKYEADMLEVAGLQKQAVTAAGATYLDLRSAFLNPDGTYTDKGPDDTGEIRKLRARDGFTFFKQGNNRFGQLLLAAIEAEPAVPAAAPATPATAPAQAAASAAVAPTFGQAAADGQEQTFQPDLAELASAPVPVQLTLKEPVSRSEVMAGSNAEKLFVEGVLPPAPKGRFDDFSFDAPVP
jgi:hypothetical protein